MTRRLNRAQDGRPAAPIRIVHLGLGNFLRAHEAMYTDKAHDAAQWGIAAFTGSSVAIAETMAAQDGLYELIVHRPEGNEYEVISSISATHSGRDVARFADYLRDPAVAIVSTTITEAGYLQGAAGIDLSNKDVQADIAVLSAGDFDAVTTAPGKLVAGLLARREAGAGPITFLPCDNVPDNGAMAAAVLTSLANAVDPTLVEWMAGNVGFATTMVDRITPQASQEALQALADDEGIADPAAVATEPFTEWVIAGEFLAGRPAWEDAGALFVENITPHELRKLWLLNGSHSLMAYAATIVGFSTVAEAISDPVVAGWVGQWWDVAAKHLPLPASEVDAYRTALLERFSNPRMRDQLSRIAADGSAKLPIRIVPALNAERAAGGEPTGAERVVAAWVLHTRGLGAPIKDASADAVAVIGAGTLAESVTAACDYLAIPDAAARAAILALAQELQEAAV